jgi:hypothetical protein
MMSAMTVLKALEALKDNVDKLHEVPFPLLEQENADSLRLLLRNRHGEEEVQNRSNDEWVDLIRQENDPLEAAKLVLDWVADKAQAWETQRGYEEERGAPDSQRMSR